MFRPDPKPVKTEKQKRKRVRKVSNARSNLLQVYKLCREIHLKENPSCVRCGGVATEIHHAKEERTTC